MNNEKQKHSPEPWSEETVLTLKQGDTLVSPLIAKPLSIENWERAKSCVNALAGIEDPESYLKQIKEEREQLMHLLESCITEFESAEWDFPFSREANELLTKLKGEAHL